MFSGFNKDDVNKKTSDKDVDEGILGASEEHLGQQPAQQERSGATPSAPVAGRQLDPATKGLKTVTKKGAKGEAQDELDVRNGSKAKKEERYKKVSAAIRSGKHAGMINVAAYTLDPENSQPNAEAYAASSLGAAKTVNDTHAAALEAGNKTLLRGTRAEALVSKIDNRSLSGSTPAEIAASSKVRGRAVKQAQEATHLRHVSKLKTAAVTGTSVPAVAANAVFGVKAGEAIKKVAKNNISNETAASAVASGTTGGLTGAATELTTTAVKEGAKIAHSAATATEATSAASSAASAALRNPFKIGPIAARGLCGGVAGALAWEAASVGVVAGVNAYDPDGSKRKDAMDKADNYIKENVLEEGETAFEAGMRYAAEDEGVAPFARMIREAREMNSSTKSSAASATPTDKPKPAAAKAKTKSTSAKKVKAKTKFTSAKKVKTKTKTKSTSAKKVKTKSTAATKDTVSPTPARDTATPAPKMAEHSQKGEKSKSSTQQEGTYKPRDAYSFNPSSSYSNAGVGRKERLEMPANFIHPSIHRTPKAKASSEASSSSRSSAPGQSDSSSNRPQGSAHSSGRHSSESHSSRSHSSGRHSSRGHSSRRHRFMQQDEFTFPSMEGYSRNQSSRRDHASFFSSHSAGGGTRAERTLHRFDNGSSVFASAETSSNGPAKVGFGFKFEF